MIRLLLIHENDSFAESLATLFEQEGYEVNSHNNLSGALPVLGEGTTDVMIVDLRIGEIDCLDFIQEARRISPYTEILIIATQDALGVVLRASKLGVHDFVRRPFESEEILLKVERAAEKKQMTTRLNTLEKELNDIASISNSIGVMPEVTNVLKSVVDIGGSESTILINGEKGTGKEMLARMIHKNSRRSKYPFVVFNCQVTPLRLHNTMLFGTSNGNAADSFSGGHTHIAKADRGSLVINHLDRLSIAAQKNLLRYIRCKDGKKAAGNITECSDVRVIALTESDLRHESQVGRFNDDLFNILNGIPIYIPPLRDRKEDINLLIDYYINVFRERFNKPNLKMSQRAMSHLVRYQWPGNVNELESVIGHSASICVGNTIMPSDLPKEIGIGYEAMLHNALEKDFTIAELEKEYIFEVLDRVSWNKTKAAEKLGITRATLLNKLKLYKNGRKAVAAVM